MKEISLRVEVEYSQEDDEEKIEFPCLMIDKEDKTIVFILRDPENDIYIITHLTGKNKGMSYHCLHEEVFDIYNLFNGSVTLRNVMEKDEEMYTCMICGKQFNPSNDFIEPTETAELFINLVGDTKAESTCPNCAYELINKLQVEIDDFYDLR